MQSLPIRLWNYARMARPDLYWADLVYIHTTGLPLIGGNAPRVLKVVGDIAWERSIRRGWISPTTDIDEFQQHHYSPFAELQKLIRNRNAQSMDGIIVPSHYLKRMVTGWGVNPERITVIYNAIDHFKTLLPSQADARQKLGWDDTPTLLTVARLVAWKGIDHIMQALQAVPKVRLMIAGDGPMEAQLKAQAKALNLTDRVIFLGKVSRSEMPLYMQATDYVILYSGYEGLSHVLLESLRAGTPIIASDKGGNPEVVQHDTNGLLVPYVNHEALVSVLKTAFESGQRDRYAANIRQQDLHQFEFAHMIEKTHHTLSAYASGERT